VRADHRKTGKHIGQRYREKTGEKFKKIIKKPHTPENTPSGDECSGTCTLNALFSPENSCVTLSQVLMKVSQN